MHPQDGVVVTGVEPKPVQKVQESDRGSHPRATVKIEDATAVPGSAAFVAPPGLIEGLISRKDGDHADNIEEDDAEEVSAGVV
jgi:hypothetical protein